MNRRPSPTGYIGGSEDFTILSNQRGRIQLNIFDDVDMSWNRRNDRQAETTFNAKFEQTAGPSLDSNTYTDLEY
jgi:hypothetical protein